MASLRRIFVVTCVVSIALSATVQNAAGQAAGAEPILKHIPAGTAGFVVVSNIKATAGRVDKFLVDLGLSAMLPAPDPDKPEEKMPVLDLLRGALQLGPGFNPDGGFAAVLLDPKPFNVDLLDLISPTRQRERIMQQMNDPDAPQKPQPKVPFVLYISGKSVDEVFGAYPMEQAGKYKLVTLPFGPVYAGQLGGYVVLSPLDKALDAVIAAEKKAPADIPAEQVKIVAQSDVAYYMNMEVVGPILAELMGEIQQQMAQEAGPMAPLLNMYFGFYGELLKQLDDITVAGRFVKTGLVFDEMVTFKADSTWSKAILAAKDAPKAQLNALPDLPYVLAVGSTGENDPESIKIGVDMLDGLLKDEFLAGIPEEEKQRLKKIAAGFSEQVTSMQMVGGGAPDGSGLFGVSFVIKCKSAAAVKDLLAEKAKLVTGLIKHFGANEPDVKNLAIRYIKGMETVGSVTADAITVEHPELASLSENDREEMKQVLGEDKVRFLVASPDDKTVVVTFGGSRAFLVEALKAAAGAGKIGTDPAALQAMKHLPKNSYAVMLFNGANLFDVIVKGMKVMEPDAELPPFRISCKVPITMGTAVTGKSVHVVIYVPTELIKEVAGIFMMFTGMGAGGPGAGPAQGGNDF